MMSHEEREVAIEKMQVLSNAFYAHAMRLGVHPFLEFTGLMNEYIKAARLAHEQGIDFTDCNVHTGQTLPLESHMLSYINEKLECIFTGQVVMAEGAVAGAAEQGS